jgi:CheY-like chemotaxis protein
LNDFKLTILHVEDDPYLAQIVKTAFIHFGFHGDMMNARSLTAAVSLLNDRARDKEPVSLIISDMQLPDGTGLDVIREVKTHPIWRATPIIVLSHDIREGVINDAYALGANSYMPKTPASGNLLNSLQSIYQYWLEDAKLPRPMLKDRLQETLERAIELRNRTSRFYFSLARVSEDAPDEVAFWLDRALNEGNLSNLLTFFLNQLSEKDLPPEQIDRFSGMQGQVHEALKTAEERLRKKPSPDTAMTYQWVLDLTDALDEEVYAEVFSYLFPKSPVAATALKSRMANQLWELSMHILNKTKEPELRRRAASLLDWSLKVINSDQ